MGELAERFGLSTDPGRPVWQLSMGERQRVEILKALWRDARVLILDDRVVSGTTQALARDHLESLGHEVQTAALVASSDNVTKVDHVAHIIDDNYQMPWGSKRGRT